MIHKDKERVYKLSMHLTPFGNSSKDVKHQEPGLSFLSLCALYSTLGFGTASRHYLPCAGIFELW